MSQINNTILWITRTGSTWRDLPLECDPCKSVYTRFKRWSISGLWVEIFANISKNNDDKFNIINSTAVKGNQHSSGAKKRSSPSIHRQICRYSFYKYSSFNLWKWILFKILFYISVNT